MKQYKLSGRMVAFAMMAWTWCSAGEASAATIPVTVTSMAIVNDGQCSLREAIIAVNMQAAYNGCPAGNGVNDTITLPNWSYSDALNGTYITVARSVKIVGGHRDSTIVNTAAFAALYVESGVTLHLENLTLRQRSDVTASQGAVYVTGGHLVLQNVRIADYRGTGLIVNQGNVEIFRSLLENNQNGALSNFATSAYIEESVFRNNSGTAIRQATNVDMGDLEIHRSTFSGNRGVDGGAIYLNGHALGQMRVYSSLFRDNVASSEGGAIYSEGQFFLYNTTVSGNSASYGGGVYHIGAESGFHGCTFTLNVAVQGGGVYARGSQKTYMRNIFANNTAPTRPDIDATNISGQYNLVRNTSGYQLVTPNTTDILGVDPLLGPLTDMGGLTLVHPLFVGSPAIDRIPAELVDSPVILANWDQRGSPRPQDGDDNELRTGADIGAFEQGPFEAETLTVQAKTSNVSHVIHANSEYSGDQGTRLVSTADGHFVTYAVRVIEPGTHWIRIRFRRGINRGMVQLATAESPNGPYTNRGPVRDLYFSSESWFPLPLTVATFNTIGIKYIRLTVVGKNAASTSRNIYIDWVHMKKI